MNVSNEPLKEVKIYNKIGELLMHIYKAKEPEMWGVFCYDKKYASGLYSFESILEIQKNYEKDNMDVQEIY